MKTIALVVLCATLAAAQTLTLSTPTPNVRPGQTVDVKVTFTASATAPIAAMQFAPASVTAFGGAPTATTAVAGKTLTCGPATCVLSGLNATAIATGEVAALRWTVPAGAAPGPQTVSVASPLGASPTAAAVSIPVPASVTVRVLSRFDLDGDGLINMSDATLVVDQIAGRAACTTGDFNGDTKCDVVDLMTLVVAALGG